jgi:hypothetical protein
MLTRLIAGVALATLALASTSGGDRDGHRKAFAPGREKDSRHRGPGTHRAGPKELALRDRIAGEVSAKLAATNHADIASVPATSWVSMGPTDADQEFNSIVIEGVDSGRPNGIAVDPRDSNVVYMAVSGGGLWKTFNFGSDEPEWNPVTDLQPNLAIGAFALDPTNPDTIYVGNGDFTDASGDTVVKSPDGGTTWDAPVQLSGTAPDGVTPLVPLSTRGLGVDGKLVLAGTDVGLFTSTDAGQTFKLTVLPNQRGNQVPDSVWSVVSTGGSAWVASGVGWCSNTIQGGQGFALVFGGTEASSTCPDGNDGLIWFSPDGATWSIATMPVAQGIGRITIGAGALAGAKTVLYAMVGSVDGSTTAGFWRSNDAGHTWVDVTGTLSNPSLGGSGADCGDMNLGHDQSWYNQSVVVDPTNSNNVMVGGNLCGARTLNGGSAAPTWELISHWLPNPFSGATNNGLLPYVHADWHTSYASLAGSGSGSGSLLVFAGTDGGIFTATDVFDPNTPGEQVQWINHNHGLVTHLVYQIGTGDPATQNPFILIAGLQDNGTRYRADPNNPSVFNQPFGGDGIGAAVHVSTSGTTYWCSAEFSHGFCQPSASVDCSQGENWNESDPNVTSAGPFDKIRGEDDDDDDLPQSLARSVRAQLHEDEEPFFVHYANVETDGSGQSVLTHTDEQVWVASAGGSAGMQWTAIAQDLSNDPNGEGYASVTASRVTPGLYGAAGLVSLAPFFVSTTGNTPSTWVAASPVQPSTAEPTARLTGASSIDFPPTLGSGQVPGQVYIGAFTGVLNDTAGTPPPDNQGRLYRTEDGGKTWTSIVGQNAGRQLPNVPVYVVKYDPIVATTIYAATDVGVYFTTDDGANWDRMGTGFPVISTRDLYVAKNQDFIRVATYGRGLWEIYPSAAENSGSPGNGDFDRNLEIDWVDVAALSSRLGETPAVTTPPLYTWIDDIVQSPTAPTAQITDDDLTALMTNFGGHP